MTIAEALQYSRAILAGSDSPEIDGQVLLCHVLSCATSYLHTWSDKELTAKQQDQFEQLIKQRQQGRPVAHLTGQRGFWSLDLKVSEDTLIPRPDTELLVNLALTKIEANMIVADLGTGSGAIALSLAVENPLIPILAMDYSLPALMVAKQNAQDHLLTNVSFWQGHWLDSIADSCLNMVVSNPPYIEDNDPHLKQGDVRFEPRTALASGVDGLDDIRQIVKQSQRCLKPKGWLMIEHGYQQAEQVITLFQKAGFTSISVQQDYGANDRVVIGQLPL